MSSTELQGPNENNVTASYAVDMDPMQLIAVALNHGADVDKLEKLMDLRDRWVADNARKAYMQAMTAFKAEPLVVEKRKHVKFGNTEFNHADLADVVMAVVQAMSKHGLSHQWSTEQDKGWVKVTCTITHEQGHSEYVAMSGPVDTSGSKNPIQAIGSTVTYLQRYTLMAITGLAARDMDDDGKASAEVNSVDASWRDAVDSCTTPDELGKLKHEMVAAYKGSKNVPAALKSQCQAKAAQLAQAA